MTTTTLLAAIAVLTVLYLVQNRRLSILEDRLNRVVATINSDTHPKMQEAIDKWEQFNENAEELIPLLKQWVESRSR